MKYLIRLRRFLCGLRVHKWRRAVGGGMVGAPDGWTEECSCCWEWRFRWPHDGL